MSEELKSIIHEIYLEESPSFDLQRKFFDLFFSIYDSSCYGYAWTSIPEEKLLEDSIYYAIMKDPSMLLCFPKTKLTYDVCLAAIKNSKHSTGSLVRAVPRDFFDYNFCLECVLKDTKNIKIIPADFVTNEFINDLLSRGINLDNFKTYINECFSINNYDDYSLSTNDFIINTNDLYKDLEIPLSDLEDYFSKYCFAFFKDKNISTLAQLFTLYDSGNIASIVPNDSAFIVEIMNTIKLLKCKYFDIDPLINENSDDDLIEVLERMGVSARCRNSFKSKHFSTRDFFKIIRLGEGEKKFKDFRNLGEKSITQLINKANIITGYHDKMSADYDDIELYELDKELNTLLEEKDRLNNEISHVISLIKDRKAGLEQGRIRK